METKDIMNWIAMFLFFITFIGFAVSSAYQSNTTFKLHMEVREQYAHFLSETLEKYRQMHERSLNAYSQSCREQNETALKLANFLARQKTLIVFVNEEGIAQCRAVDTATREDMEQLLERQNK